MSAYARGCDSGDLGGAAVEPGRQQDAYLLSLALRRQLRQAVEGFDGSDIAETGEPVDELLARGEELLQERLGNLVPAKA